MSTWNYETVIYNGGNSGLTLAHGLKRNVKKVTECKIGKLPFFITDTILNLKPSLIVFYEG